MNKSLKKISLMFILSIALVNTVSGNWFDQIKAWVKKSLNVVVPSNLSIDDAGEELPQIEETQKVVMENGIDISLVNQLAMMNDRVVAYARQDKIEELASRFLVETLKNLNGDLQAGQHQLVEMIVKDLAVILDELNSGDLTKQAVTNYAQELYMWYLKGEYKIADRYQGYRALDDTFGNQNEPNVSKNANQYWDYDFGSDFEG